MLQILNEMPAMLLDCDALSLAETLAGPSLIHLPGRQEQPLFVSVLLHGDEITGWQALQDLLRSYQNKELPRALSIFIGNVTAAAAGVRRLDEQPDFNRIWPGGLFEDCDEAKMARQVIADMQARKVFASVDIHNNTGINPHYACVNRMDHAFLHMASWFSRTVVYFTHPRGTQTSAFAALCPSVTLECGKPDTPHGTVHAREYIEACLRTTRFPERSVLAEDIDLFRTVGVVKIPETISFGFADDAAEISFDPELDHFNFRELETGTTLARLNDPVGVALQVMDCNDIDVATTYFTNLGHRLCIKAPFMPAMLTLSERAIRQDCLCYVMERMLLPA